MIKRILVALAITATSAAAHADFLGLYAGVGYWHQTFGGHVIDHVSIDNELGVNHNNGNYIYVELEHPIPVIPDIRISRTAIDDTGNGMLNTSFNYQGKTFTTGQRVHSEIDLTSTDLTLFYQIIDTGVHLDLGLTGRFVNGMVAVDNANHGVKIGLPMIYAHARIPLPFTHTYADGTVNYMSWRGDQVSDYAIGVGWQTREFLFPEFGVELGWRRFAINASQANADVNVDAAVKGMYVNLTAHF